MRFKRILLAAGVLCITGPMAVPVLAAPGPETPDSRQIEPRAEPILWPFPAELTAGEGPGRVELEVEIYGDGVLLHRERMEVERPTPAELGVVQLLARSPRESEALVGMAERGNVELEARFLVDGVHVESVPLGDLVGLPEADRKALRHLSQTYETEADGPAKTPRLAPKGLDCTERNACLMDCNDLYLDCIDSGVCFPQIMCEVCDYQLQQCQQACPPCECEGTQSVETHDEIFLIGTYFTGFSQCYEDPWESDFYDGWFYDERAFVYQKNTVEVTTYCDGSTSEQVIATSYIYNYCYVKTFLVCYYPFSWPPATC